MCLKVIVCREYFLANVLHCCHGNPAMAWHHHSSATSLLIKFDNEIEKNIFFLIVLTIVVAATSPRPGTIVATSLLAKFDDETVKYRLF